MMIMLIAVQASIRRRCPVPVCIPHHAPAVVVDSVSSVVKATALAAQVCCQEFRFRKVFYKLWTTFVATTCDT